MHIRVFYILLSLITMVAAQDKDAFSTDESGKKGLLDPSRLTVHNSLSFGAASGGGYSDLKSQSLYSTMMRYQFTSPVTLNLNFSLPLHSTFSPAYNLNSANMQSMDYFRSIPFEMSLSWQPTKNTTLHFSIVKPPAGYYYSGYNSFYRPWSTMGMTPFP